MRLSPPISCAPGELQAGPQVPVDLEVGPRQHPAPAPSSRWAGGLEAGWPGLSGSGRPQAHGAPFCYDSRLWLKEAGPQGSTPHASLLSSGPWHAAAMPKDQPQAWPSLVEGHIHHGILPPGAGAGRGPLPSPDRPACCLLSGHKAQSRPCQPRPRQGQLRAAKPRRSPLLCRQLWGKRETSRVSHGPGPLGARGARGRPAWPARCTRLEDRTPAWSRLLASRSSRPRAHEPPSPPGSVSQAAGGSAKPAGPSAHGHQPHCSWAVWEQMPSPLQPAQRAGARGQAAWDSRWGPRSGWRVGGTGP